MLMIAGTGRSDRPIAPWDCAKKSLDAREGQGFDDIPALYVKALGLYLWLTERRKRSHGFLPVLPGCQPVSWVQHELNQQFHHRTSSSGLLSRSKN